MCEQFVVRAAEPFRPDDLWPYDERLERFGIAEFGWGASWLRPGGGLAGYVHTAAFRDDPERGRVGAVETTSALVLLRRPHHDAGNPENPVSTFRLGRIGIASTAIDPVDRSLFRYAGRGATERALTRLHTAIALDHRGRPVEASPGRPT